MNDPITSGARMKMRYTGLSSMSPIGQKPSWQNDIETIAASTNTSEEMRVELLMPAMGPQRRAPSRFPAFTPSAMRCSLTFDAHRLAV